MRATNPFLILLLISVESFAAPSLEFERCLATQGARQIDALCATLERAENPKQPDGKQIQLSIIKLPSRSAQPKADAFTLIQGGPGGSSISMAIAYDALLEGVRTDRDVLVVDQRGTGRSNILACPELEPDSFIGDFDVDEIKKHSEACVQSIDSDLRYYTTSIAVQDLDAVRAAAGYPRLTIYGVSYGTRVAQHYLRRFEKNTRAVILDGVAHVGLNLAGGEIARQSQIAFDTLAKRCAESTECKDQFGDIKLKLGELLIRLDKQAVELRIADPISGEMVDKKLVAEDVLGVIRLMAYSTEQNALLPMLISYAHAGNYHPLAAQSLMIGEDFLKDYATGMNNTVMCAEDQPYVSAFDLTDLENTYLGDKMAQAIKAICSVWPRGPIDEDFHQPFSSSVPVLILSGETDPITPPSNGEYAHDMFSNSKHIIVPSHGHGVWTRGCVPQLSLNFIEQASFEDINTACIERENAMPFFNNTAGPKP
ncbi:MAG: pimeloyl-ACP methyl ester carboxylesterase [Cryomorphaceae bacterium]|jgi:pimeloyl-ACP methyl ester carboxylesterase